MKKKIQYKFKSDDKLFFTSDLHLNHFNILKFCNRPFNSVEEMDEALIKNWNDTVPEDGIVFILGDFCFGGFPAWEYYVSRLNGVKYLIKGNHDMQQNLQNEDRLNAMFEWIGLQLQIEVGNRKLYLSHYPFLCYAGTYRSKGSAIFNLFGHVHTCLSNNTGKDFERLANLFPTQYDVGVDFNNYRPVSFKEIEEMINYQIDNNTNMLCWIK